MDTFILIKNVNKKKQKRKKEKKRKEKKGGKQF
jgi:hypothetical protein